MKILGIIPARAGSKGIPGKNIKLLNDKPLLQYTAEVALESAELDRVILSTDNEEIATVGRNCGLDVPFLRPCNLSTDTSTAVETIRHAVNELEQSGQEYDAICYLQPTSPCRHSWHINKCVEEITRHNCDSVFTMRRVPNHFNPHWVFFKDSYGQLIISTQDEEIIPNRQSLPAAYHRDGSVYIVRHNIVMNENSLYGKRIRGVLIEDDFHVNIDTLEDWARAEAIMRETHNA